MSLKLATYTTDDIGWINDLVEDDDENSLINDFHGFDFVDELHPLAYPYPNEDYSGRDNNVFSHDGHGTWVASQIASSANHGRMMGVAPGVRILPVRIGRATLIDGCPIGKVSIPLFVLGIAYLREMGVDIITSSVGNPGGVAVRKAVQAAINDGIVYVQAAGNDGTSTPIDLESVRPSLIVAGLDDFGNVPVDEYGNIGTNFGNWVDVSTAISVIAPNVTTNCSPPGEYTDMSGTSMSTPLVAGVCALVKSVYPQFTNEDIINKIISSTEDIYANGQNAGFVGLLGSGRVNAYKALTVYGQISSSSPDTTWNNDVWISGDIVVPEGKTLYIAAGTTVHVAQDDILSAGGSPDEIEFLVEGNLVINGTESEQVVLECFRDGAQTWGPIIFGSDQASNLSSFSHVVFRDMKEVVKKASPTASNRVKVTFDNCRFETSNEESAIVVEGLDSGDYLTITDCEFVGTGVGSGYAVVAGPNGTSVDYGITVTGTTISGYGGGLDVQGGSNLSLSDLNISNCGDGLVVNYHGVGSMNIGPNIAVDQIGATGIYIGGGEYTPSTFSVSNCGGTGIYLQGGKPIMDGYGPGFNVSNCGLHGLVLDSLDYGSWLQYGLIENCTNTGVRIINCDPSLGGQTITGSGYAGIFLDGASPDLFACGIASNNIGTGVRVTNGSDPWFLSSDVSGVDNAIVVDSVSYGTFGAYTGTPGVNDFSSIQNAYVLNLNVSNGLPFYFNCYEGSPSPDPRKMGSKYLTTGPVHFSPGYCE